MPKAGEMGALAAGSDMATGQSQTTCVQEAAAANCLEDAWSSFQKMRSGYCNREVGKKDERSCLFILTLELFIQP